jgi:hypothetical protein
VWLYVALHDSDILKSRFPLAFQKALSVLFIDCLQRLSESICLACRALAIRVRIPYSRKDLDARVLNSLLERGNPTLVRNPTSSEQPPSPETMLLTRASIHLKRGRNCLPEPEIWDPSRGRNRVRNAEEGEANAGSGASNANAEARDGAGD